MVWEETLRPTVPIPATTPWADTRDTPMVISGRIIVNKLRYTISKIVSSANTVATSMVDMSRSPMSLMSLKVPAGPVVYAVNEVPATVLCTVSMARFVAAIAFGVATSPTMLTGSSHALLSLLASISRSGGVVMKSCSAATSSVSARSAPTRFR